MRRRLRSCSLLLAVFALAACGRGEDGPRGDAPRGATPAAAAADTLASAVDTLAALAPMPVPAESAAAGSGSGAGSKPPQASPSAPAERDSAARILLDAAERYRAVRTLQADFTMRLENTLLRSTIESAGVLYQKRPDRLLLRFTDPAGDVILSDGEFFWVYYPSVDAEQVIRSPASAGGSTGVDLQAQFLGDPTRRFDYTLEAREAVGGRDAWRMRLVPRERVGYRALRVWLDRQDLLARRFEITEDNGSMRRFELRNLRVNGNVADELFRFQPPAGARVITQ